MRFLERFFATRRELQRLAGERNFWQARCVSLEKDNKVLGALVLKRDEEWADRFLTAMAKTHPIAYQAQARATDTEQEKQTYELEKSAFLAARKSELISDALEAGLTASHAEATYSRELPDYIAEFETAFSISN